MAKPKALPASCYGDLKGMAMELARSRRDPCPPGPIRVALGHPADGWVQMAILCATWQQSVVISCSDVYNPFGCLKLFLKQVADQDLPASFTIEEEGPSKTLWAFASDLGDDLVEFFVTASDWMTQEQCRSAALLKCRIPRLDLVAAFGLEVSQWLRAVYQVSEFGGRDDYGDGPECDLRQLWFDDDTWHQAIGPTETPLW